MHSSVWRSVSLVIVSLLATSALAVTTPDFQVNDNASADGSEQSAPCVATAPDGSYALVWMDDRSGIGSEPCAQIIQADGTPLGANFWAGDFELVGAKYSPAVAIDPAGDLVVCWLQRRFFEVSIHARRFAADGTPLGESFRIDGALDDVECSCPSVSVGPDGVVTVVWVDDRHGDYDVFAQRLTLDGEALGGSIQVSDDLTGATQYFATSVADGQGGTVVTWADQRGGSHDVYMQRILADGSMPGANIRVDTDDSGATAYVPVAAVAGNGNVIVAWQDGRHGFSDIYAQMFTADDQPMGANLPVTDISLEVHERGPAIVADATGGFVVGWNDESSGHDDVFFRRFSAAGGPSGPVVRVNNDTDEASQRGCVVAMAADGAFCVAWNDRRLGDQGDVFAQTYISSGVPWGSNIRVNDDVGSGNQSDPAVAVAPDGGFIVVWTDHPGHEERIAARRYAPGGIALGDQIVVAADLGATNPGDPDVAIDGAGDFVVVWVDLIYGARYGSRIYGRRFDASGQALGEAFRVDTDTYSCSGARVACQPGGEFLVCWSNEPDDSSRFGEPDVYGQLYRADGTAVGGNFKLNDDTGTADQRSPDLAVDGAGNYVVVWSDTRGGFEQPHVQRLDSNGAFLGDNQPVDGVTIRHYRRTTGVAADSAGNFVVAWVNEEGGNRGLALQRFDAEAVAQGPVVTIDLAGGDLEVAPPALALGDGGALVVAWTEQRDGGTDVIARQYGSDGSPFGDTFVISDTTEWIQAQPNVAMEGEQIYVCWRDNRGAQTQHDIYAKLLDWSAILGVEGSTGPPPSPIWLEQNFPNPFNPRTTIRYRVPVRSPVSLQVLNVRGERVSTLVEALQDPGVYEVDVDGTGLPSGVYLYRLRMGELDQVQRMVLVR